MPLTSDITINVSKFAPSSVTESTKNLNILVEKLTSAGPYWYDVGAAKYREMRELGQTPLPVPVYLPEAKDTVIPSREKGRDIPVRVYTPDNGEESRGLLLHFHGGGFVVGTERHSDRNLKRWANSCQLTAISVGYRLAPENPHPAAIEDSFDAAEYFVDHGETTYGAKLLFIAGDSAGANLAVASTFHLLRARPAHKLNGVVAPFGYLDLTHTLPQAASFTKPLIINLEILNRFTDAYVPGKDIIARQNPLISPLHEDFKSLAMEGKASLPPALFLCGTEDPLLDDTLLIGLKWQMAGAEAVVKIFPGAPHGFLAFAGAGVEVADEGAELIVEFLRDRLQK